MARRERESMLALLWGLVSALATLGCIGFGSVALFVGDYAKAAAMFAIVAASRDS